MQERLNAYVQIVRGQEVVNDTHSFNKYFAILSLTFKCTVQQWFSLKFRSLLNFTKTDLNLLGVQDTFITIVMLIVLRTRDTPFY